MAEKECFKCKTLKPLSGFYRHHGMADGHLNKCKECAKKDVVENRYKNHGKYNEYDRKRFADRPERRKQISETARRMRELYPEKYRARAAMQNAVRDGRLEKLSVCQDCGCKPSRIEGHHEDYSKPLDILWLCVKCHKIRHRTSKYANNA